MDDLFLTVIVPAIVGALVSYIGALTKNALDARVKIDESLRSTRLELYKVLWQETGLLPRWPRAAGVTYEQLSEMSKRFRDWYFNVGGIYLSMQARRAYGKLQETIALVVVAAKTDTLSDTDYDAVQKKCSDFRTELTRDLQSRRRAFTSL